MKRPPEAYLRRLGALLSTSSASERLKHSEELLTILQHTTTTQSSLIPTLTTQAISQLFTNDHLVTPTSQWSRHPSHTEPLLESLLNLLTTSFSQPLLQQPPEPAVASTPPAFSTLYPAPYPDLNHLSTAFDDATRSLALSTAHLLHLLTTLSTERAPRIARLSHHVLAALTRLLPPDTRAAFLPGLISSLSKALSHASTVHSTVCIAALDALHVVLTTFHLPLSEHRPSVPSRSNDRRPRLSVVRDEQWVRSAAHEAALRVAHFLAAPASPLHHTSPRARQYLASFVSAHLRTTALTDPSCRALLRMTLFSLAGDDFPSVRNVALHNLVMLVTRGHVTIQEIHRGIRAVVIARGMNAVPWKQSDKIKQLMRHDEEAFKRLSRVADSVWTRVATGFLNTLVPPRDAEGVSAISSDKLASSVVIIGPTAFCHMLMELLSEQWAVAEDSEDGVSAALDCLVLRAAASLGREGLLTSVFPTLVGRAQLDELDGSDEAHLQRFRERGYAALVLQAVLRGEVEREDVKYAEAHQRLVYECTKETLQAMNGFFLPTADILRSGRVDDDMISMKHCLLVCTARLFEDLADLHREVKIRPLGADITLVVLMSLLRDVSNGELSVRKSARETITRISRAIGWKNERRLLSRHLNYVIGRVIRNLEKKWAGDVLRFVIGNEGDYVSREATVLLESTLQRMNESLASADDERASTTMNSIINVLSTAVAQKQAQEQGLDPKESQNVAGKLAEEVLYQNDLSDLRRTLFAYTTDEVPNYDKLTSKVEITNKPFLEDDGSDDESNRSAFETIATHVLEGTRDILVGRPWHVCAASLLCATLSVKLLEGRQRTLLPFAAKILPLLPDQFKVLNEELTPGEQMLRDFRQRKFGDLENGDNVEDLVTFLNNKGQELPVVTNACLLLAAFSAYAGSFIRDRFVRLIYPKMRPLLRLTQYFPTLLEPARFIKSTNRATTPSYGAMSACDACLEAIASVALVTPDVLAPFAGSLVEYLSVFFDPKFDPSISPKRHVVHTNRSMVRFECERWIRRSEFADTIVRQLKIVNATDVLTMLLKYDNTAPNEIKPVHESLHAITVRQS